MTLPNRATSFGVRYILQEETSFGILASGQNAYGLELASDTLRNNIGSVDGQFLVGKGNLAEPGRQGNEDPAGDINGELQPHGPWPLLLLHALGGSVVTTGSGPYVHQLEGKADTDLPVGFTLEKRFRYQDGAFNRLRYLGCKVDEFFLRVQRKQIVTCRARLVARQELEVASDMDASPSFPADNEPFNSTSGAVLLDLTGGGSRTPIATLTTIELAIRNQIKRGQYSVDQGALRREALAGGRLVTGTMTAFFTETNWQLYQRYLADTVLSLEFTLSRDQWSWKVVIPKIKIRGTTPQVPGRGPLNLDLPFFAHRDDALGADIQVTITNNDPVISTAA